MSKVRGGVFHAISIWPFLPSRLGDWIIEIVVSWYISIIAVLQQNSLSMQQASIQLQNEKLVNFRLNQSAS